MTATKLARVDDLFKGRSTDKGLYLRAVRWVAYNDEDAITDLDHIKDMISVALLSDVFGVSQDTIAAHVLHIRETEL